MTQRYDVAVSLVGAGPGLGPLLDDDTRRERSEPVDGILVPGGVDLDPTTDGEAPHPRPVNIDPSRERTEILMTNWAVEDREPSSVSADELIHWTSRRVDR